MNAKPLALVTGATGFVGSSVARCLVQAGYAVRVLARPGSDRRNLDGVEAELAEGDLNDAASLKAALANCRYLFHVAADYRLWVRRPAEMIRTNVEGTRALMEAALAQDVERIVYTSSVAALGIVPGGYSADEETPSTIDDMVGVYKRSKFLAEEAVHELYRTRNLPVVIVNPSTPIGPRDIKPTPTGRIIVEAASGRIPAYVDTGLNLAHVDDVARGHLLALEKGQIGERYILGGDNFSLAQMLAEIADLRGRKAAPIRIPRRAVYPIAYIAEAVAYLTDRQPMTTVDSLRMAKKTMFFSCAKAERELGYTHRPAREALRDAISWFQTHGYIR